MKKNFKIIILSSLLLLSNQQLSAEDWNFSEEDIEVVDSKKLHSNYDKNSALAKSLDKNNKEEINIEENMKELNLTNNKSDQTITLSELSTEDFLKDKDTEEDIIAPSFIKQEKKEPQFKPKKYYNVKFRRDYEWYSIIPHNKKEFKKYIDYLSLPDETIRHMYGKVNSTKSIKLNAFAYDYAKHDASIAENYYRLFSKKMGFFDGKIRYADYLIRTGRPTEVKKILKRRDCSANIKRSAQCFYYLGVSEYLTTGNNKNASLKMAKPWIKKAKLIYNKK
jgi:hypothetical protein